MLLCAQHVLPVTSEPFKRGAVLVRDGVIRDIGPAAMLRMRYPEEEVRDYGHAALMPGLIDLHTHLENSVMRGSIHDMPYASWAVAIAEKGMRLDATDWRDSAIVGGLEALSNGITCVADITATGAVCAAVQELGLRGVIYREVGVMDKKRIPQAVARAGRDLERWSGNIDEGRVTLGVAPASMYECHPAVYGAVADFARQEGLPVAMHLAGSREEYNFIKYGSSPFAVHVMEDRRGYIEVPPWLPTQTSPICCALNWGAFEADNVLAIHCVHVDNRDIAKLKAYDVAVAVCARCNAQLGMGVAPMVEFRRSGLRMGLGSDSSAATDSTDMFIEMRTGMLIQRAVSLEFLDAAAMLEMATMGGARALRMDDRIGSLDVGKRADMIAVDLSGAHRTSLDDPAAAIVNTCSGSDVIMTMVDGSIRYERDHWNVGVDFARNLARAIEIREKIRS